MKTIYKMTIAAVLAATMGSAALAASTTVPGIPSDTFKFNQVGSAETPSTGGGVVAITNINAILDATNSNFSTASFWKSFIAPERVKIFDYDEAKDMIEELIFTVEGKYWDANTDSYKDTSESANSGLLDLAEDKDSSVSSGKWENGRLAEKGNAAVLVLTESGYTASQTTAGAVATDGTITTATFIDASASDKAGLLATILAAGSSFSVDAQKAVISQVAFDNANTLIDLIGQQVKNGYVLDVAAATSALDDVIDHHNSFLTASIIKKAVSLKDVIKNVGLTYAASAVLQSTRYVCTSNGDSALGGTITPRNSACVKIGEKVVSISNDIAAIPLIASSVADYNQAILDIKTLSGQISTFNTMTGVSGFTSNNSTAAAEAATAIETQFGTIMVVEGSDAYNHLENTGTTGNLFGVEDWTLVDSSDIMLGSETLFDATFDISITSNVIDTVTGDITGTNTFTSTGEL